MEEEETNKIDTNKKELGNLKIPHVPKLNDKHETSLSPLFEALYMFHGVFVWPNSLHVHRSWWRGRGCVRMKKRQGRSVA